MFKVRGKVFAISEPIAVSATTHPVAILLPVCADLEFIWLPRPLWSFGGGIAAL